MNKKMYIKTFLMWYCMIKVVYVRVTNGDPFIWKMYMCLFGVEVIHVASNGFAFSLLEDGRTPLSRFEIPINLSKFASV